MGSFLFLWDKEFLNQKQIDNIRRHKYKAEGSSLVEPVFQVRKQIRILNC